MFTNEELDFIKSKGFKQEKGKYSGYFFIVDANGKTTIIIPKQDGFVLEIFEMFYDGDGCFEENFTKEYSKTGQTLKDFIEDWI